MKALRVFLSLLVLLIAVDLTFAADINNIFNAYKDKNVSVCFKQESINGMTGQKIERFGKLFIEAKREMVFDYGREKIIINNFRVVDVNNGKKTVYKLSGFNRVLFLMFLGRKDLSELFSVRKIKRGDYLLLPKYQSNIDKVFVGFDNGSVGKIEIVDIYANKTVYLFDAAYCKRALKRDKTSD